MIKSMKEQKLVVILAAGLFVAAPMCAAETAAQPKTPPPSKDAAANLFPDKVIAKGKGFEVKQSELDTIYTLVKANYESRGMPIPEAQRAELSSRVLQNIIVTKLLVARAKDADKAKAKEATDKQIAEEKKRMPSEEIYQLQIKAMGMTMEQYQKNALEQQICQAVIDREVGESVKVTEADAKKFYDENVERFKQPERVRAAHVLVSIKDPADTNPNPAQRRDLSDKDKAAKKKLAESIRDRARKGEDFAKLAKEFSDDPGSKDKGGEYTFGRGEMVPEFEAAAFGQGVNEVSDPVTTVYGYHVIKTLEKIPARTIPYSELAERIKKYLHDQKMQELMPEYFEKLKKDAAIEILDESLKPKDTKPAAAPKSPDKK